jgi:hypothetical protein
VGYNEPTEQANQREVAIPSPEQRRTRIHHVEYPMSQQRASPSPARNRRFVLSLRGALLLLAWAGWIAGVGVALGLFALGLPIRFHQLATLSTQAAPALQHAAAGPFTTPPRVILSAHVYPLVVLTQEILLVTGLTFVGLVLIWRKPRQWSAIIFSLAMITYGPYITGVLGSLLVVHPEWQMPIRLAQTLGIGGAVLSGYLFPDGRFVPPWTRLLTLLWIPWILAGLVVPSLFLNFTNPYTVSISGLLALIGWLFTTLLAQAGRYRHASGQMQRQQTKWVLLCMTTTIVTYSVFMLPYVFIPALNQPGTPSLLYTLIGYPLFLLSLPVSPVVIFIAILRHHLFDIDTLVNRALVYGTLTFTLGLIYAGSILVLEYLLNGLTGGSQLALVGSTLTTAALFQPLRTRIQQSIDRRFYRRKYDAAKTVAALSATLQNDVDLQQVCERVVALVEDTMQPESVSLWLPPPGWQEQRQREALSE